MWLLSAVIPYGHMIKEQAVGFGFAVLFTFHREHFHLNDKTTEINTQRFRQFTELKKLT